MTNAEYVSFYVYAMSDHPYVSVYASDVDHPYTVEGKAEKVLVDVVYYLKEQEPTVDEVRDSLINHDAYPAEVIVERGREIGRTFSWEKGVRDRC